MGLAERVVSKEALEEARAAGAAEARVEARAEYVLRLLAVRGIYLPPSTHKRILACKDPAQLDRWFDRAMRARSIEEVLGQPAQRRPRRSSTARGEASRS